MIGIFQFVVGEIRGSNMQFLQIHVKSFHITIKLMEIEEGKVEIDEIDLGFCLIHVLYRVLPRGYTYLMGVYRIEKKHSRMNKMIIFKAKQVFFFQIYSFIMNKTWQIQ
jgi:hypothetical protein